MKKLILSLMMAAAVTTATFAQPTSNNNKVESTVKEAAQKAQDAPSGTVFGVVENTNDHVTISTPLGNYTLDKNPDGSVSFLGMTAKLVSAKKGVYKIKTSIGNFTINTRNATITKD